MDELKKRGFNVKHTYGFITRHNRIKSGLEKSHINDAFVIAGGKGQTRVKPFKIKQRRRNNRKLEINRKKYGCQIRRKRYKLQSGDLVKFQSKVYRVGEMFDYGKYVRIYDLDKNVKNTKPEKVKLICYGKGLF